MSHINFGLWVGRHFVWAKHKLYHKVPYQLVTKQSNRHMSNFLTKNRVTCLEVYDGYTYRDTSMLRKRNWSRHGNVDSNWNIYYLYIGGALILSIGVWTRIQVVELHPQQHEFLCLIHDKKTRIVTSAYCDLKHMRFGPVARIESYVKSK